MSQRVRVYVEDRFAGWFTIPVFKSKTHIGNRWNRRDLAQTNLYRAADGRYILHSWDYDDPTVGRTAQLLSAAEATEWLAENNLPIPADMEHWLGGVDLDDAAPEADGPASLVIGGFRGERGRQEAETLGLALQERFGFASPAAEIPVLEKLRCLYQRTERTAAFLRNHLPRSDSRGFSFGRQQNAGNDAAMGILTGEIIALEDLLRELFGLSRDQNAMLPTCTADAVMSIIRTFDLARDFRAWLRDSPHQVAIPAGLAQRMDTALSLLHRAIHSEEAASAGQTEDPANGPRVVLGAPGERPIVGGVEKRPLTLPQYDVVKALLEAGERGLSKDDLDRKSKHGDARKILKRLEESDAGWKAVISFPGRAGGGYRIG